MSNSDNFSLADIQADPSFLNSLSFEDLTRLRAIVKQRHFQTFGAALADQDADKQISSFGPQVRERYIKEYIENKLSG